MVLVTGATGFVGRHVVAALLAGGEARVRCLVRNPDRARALLGTKVELAPGDVRDAAAVLKAVSGVERVVHLVAIIREGRGYGTFHEVNVLGTRNVAQAAEETGVRRLVHLSILGATEVPAYRYAHSKWLGEQEVRRVGVPHVVVRSSVIFGAGDEFFNLLAALVRLGPVVPVAGNGQARFQPIAVQDAARCVVTALENGRYVSQTIPLGGPEQLTYNEMVDRVTEALQMRRWKLHVPLMAMKALAWAMERLTPKAVVTVEQLSYVGQDSVAEVDAVQRLFGFTPRPIRGNIDYVRQIRWMDACRVVLGRGLPERMRWTPAASP